MAKGSERKRSGSRRKPAHGGRQKARPPAADPQLGPSLAWAKWVEALGGDALDELPATAAAAEERLRAATLAAEHARRMREMAHAAEASAVTATPTAGSPAGPPGPRTKARDTRAERARPPDAKPHPPVAPPRHDPGRTVAGEAPLGFTASADATLARALAPPEAPPAPVPRERTADPEPPPSRGSAPAPPASALEPMRDDPLPHRYDDDRITLISRDPHWLHVYWEITPANRERARALVESPAALVLRVFHFPALTGGHEGSFDVELPPEARNWYVHGGHPGHDFEVEIGLRGAGGRFVRLARSNRVRAPLDRMSDVLDEEWRNVAGDDERLYHLSGGFEGRMGAAASGELAERFARRELPSSANVSSFSLPGAHDRRGFWFVLETELVVYGATEPGASVTCQGRPVALREDGTFTLRFALPDGGQHIDCAARSADQLDTITITPAIAKQTARDKQRRDDPSHG